MQYISQNNLQKMQSAPLNRPIYRKFVKFHSEKNIHQNVGAYRIRPKRQISREKGEKIQKENADGIK